MPVRWTHTSPTTHSMRLHFVDAASGRSYPVTLPPQLPEGALLEGERQDGDVIRFTNARNSVYLKGLVSRLITGGFTRYPSAAQRARDAAGVAAPAPAPAPVAPVVEVAPVAPVVEAAPVAAVAVPVTEVAPVASVVEVACEEAAAARAEASVAEVACEEEAVGATPYTATTTVVYLEILPNGLHVFHHVPAVNIYH